MCLRLYIDVINDVINKSDGAAFQALQPRLILSYRGLRHCLCVYIYASHSHNRLWPDSVIMFVVSTTVRPHTMAARAECPSRHHHVGTPQGVFFQPVSSYSWLDWHREWTSPRAQPGTAQSPGVATYSFIDWRIDGGEGTELNSACYMDMAVVAVALTESWCRSHVVDCKVNETAIVDRIGLHPEAVISI